MILLLILWSFLAADTSAEMQECPPMKAALASWQMRVIMTSLDRFGSKTELTCFLRKLFYTTVTGVFKVMFWKVPTIKSGLPELAAQPFRKSPGLCHSVLLRACIIKSKMETEFPFLFNPLPPYLFRHFLKNCIIYQNRKFIRNLADKKSYCQWRCCTNSRVVSI